MDREILRSVRGADLAGKAILAVRVLARRLIGIGRLGVAYRAHAMLLPGLESRRYYREVRVPENALRGCTVGSGDMGHSWVMGHFSNTRYLRHKNYF